MTCPLCGSTDTTLHVQMGLIDFGRRAIGIELNPKSIDDAKIRIIGGRRAHAPTVRTGDAPLFEEDANV
jgi:hypothetical protein